MTKADGLNSCPTWCTRDLAGAGRTRHTGHPVELARPESGAGLCTARLVSRDDGIGCEVLIERWNGGESQFTLALDAADALLDALDDDGDVAFQRLAALIVDGIEIG